MHQTAGRCAAAVGADSTSPTATLPASGATYAAAAPCPAATCPPPGSPASMAARCPQCAATATTATAPPAAPPDTPRRHVSGSPGAHPGPARQRRWRGLHPPPRGWRKLQHRTCTLPAPQPLRARQPGRCGGHSPHMQCRHAAGATQNGPPLGPALQPTKLRTAAPMAEAA